MSSWNEAPQWLPLGMDRPYEHQELCVFIPSEALFPGHPHPEFAGHRRVCCGHESPQKNLLPLLTKKPQIFDYLKHGVAGSPIGIAPVPLSKKSVSGSLITFGGHVLIE